MIHKYAMMRRTYLEEHRPVEYAQLLRTGKLSAHLEEVDTQARTLVREQIELLQKEHPAPDMSNQLAWVQHMNSLKHMAEEVALKQLVYA